LSFLRKKLLAKMLWRKRRLPSKPKKKLKRKRAKRKREKKMKIR
jgi:hypothetical protein